VSINIFFLGGDVAKLAAKVHYFLNYENVSHSLWYKEEIDEIIQRSTEEERELPIFDIKELVIRQIVEMLENNEAVAKRKKLEILLLNREKRSSTGIGKGIAIPHVRTDLVKKLAMAVIITPEPIPFDSLDDKDVSIIIAIVSPPYDDTEALHKKLLSKVATFFSYEEFTQKILASQDAGEVLQLFRDEDQS